MPDPALRVSLLARFQAEAEEIIRGHNEFCVGHVYPAEPYCSCAPNGHPLCQPCAKLAATIVAALLRAEAPPPARDEDRVLQNHRAQCPVQDGYPAASCDCPPAERPDDWQVIAQELLTALKLADELLARNGIARYELASAIQHAEGLARHQRGPASDRK
jgi:hypothetical protein